jgi:hypothetical protein
MAAIEKLEARPDGIGHLLGDRYIEVPPYQRAYSWTDDQIEDLFKDLSDAIRRKDVDYFLGTVVLTTNNEGGPHAVIDGQQRLATVSILICAIRNHFHSIGDSERADGLHHRYLARKELRDLTETPHLKLIAGDNVFYERSVLARPQSALRREGKAAKMFLPASHGRLETALKLATRHVAMLVQQTNDPTGLLFDWIEYLRDKAKVIVLEVNDEAAAYTIFEVLNDRGLELSVSDLLKNYIFRIASDKVAEAQQHWTSMTSRLEASGVEEKNLKTFIRHVWASTHGLTREKNLYEAIRKIVTGMQRAVDFAAELNEQACIYAALDNPNDEFWKQYGAPVREAVDTLQLLKAVQIRPLVLAVLRRFDISETRRALPMLVCWTVRFTITGKLGSGQLESGYADRAKDVSAGEIKTAKHLFDASKGFLTSDGDFEAAFATARISAHYLGRFYLRVLEKQYASIDSAELIVNPSEEVVTLEHIMPQTREPHWINVNSEEHQAGTKRLGNLALLDKDLNEKGGNQPFAKKCVTYVSSRIALTREIAKHQTWDATAIDQRQAELARLAVKAWPLRPH